MYPSLFVIVDFDRNLGRGGAGRVSGVCASGRGVAMNRIIINYKLSPGEVEGRVHLEAFQTNLPRQNFYYALQ